MMDLISGDISRAKVQSAVKMGFQEIVFLPFRPNVCPTGAGNPVNRGNIKIPILQSCHKPLN